MEVFKISIEQETENEILYYSKLFQTTTGINEYLNIKWNEWFLDEEEYTEKTEKTEKTLNKKEKIINTILNDLKPILSQVENDSDDIDSSDESDISDEDIDNYWEIPDKNIISVETINKILENNKINETRYAKILEYGTGNIAKHAIVVKINKIILGN